MRPTSEVYMFGAKPAGLFIVRRSKALFLSFSRRHFHQLVPDVVYVLIFGIIDNGCNKRDQRLSKQYW